MHLHISTLPLDRAYDNLYKSVKGLNHLYHNHWKYPYPYQQNGYYANAPMYHYANQAYNGMNYYDASRYPSTYGRNQVKDYGRQPFALNINEAAKQNNTYRTAIWTGNHLQVTLMSINVGDDIGLEIHPHIDQFLRIEQGQGIVQMGKSKNHLDFVQNVSDDFAIMIPAGTWHNVTNTGSIPLKLYSIYAPPQHPFGTVHVTKAQALAAE